MREEKEARIAELTDLHAVELDKFISQLADVEAKLVTKDEEISRLENELEHNRQTVSDAEAELEKRSADITLLTEEKTQLVSDWESKIGALEAERDLLGEQLQAATVENEAFQDQIRSAQDQHSEVLASQREHADALLEEEKAHVADLSKQLDDLRAERSELVAEAAEMQDEVKTLTEKFEGDFAELSTKYEAQISDLSGELSSVRAVVAVSHQP